MWKGGREKVGRKGRKVIRITQPPSNTSNTIAHPINVSPRLSPHTSNRVLDPLADPIALGGWCSRGGGFLCGGSGGSGGDGFRGGFGDSFEVGGWFGGGFGDCGGFLGGSRGGARGRADCYFGHGVSMGGGLNAVGVSIYACRFSGMMDGFVVCGVSEWKCIEGRATV